MSQINVDTVRNRTGGPPSLDQGAVATGVITATTFDGDVSGNITGVAGTFSGNVTIGGTLTYEDVTNIDSVGLVTARNGLQVLAGISTFSGQTNLTNTNVTAGILTASGQTNLANVNVSAAGTVASLTATTAVVGTAVTIAASGANVTGILTATEVRLKNGTLTERVNIVANKLSAAPNINISNGMVHYFTTAETTTSIPNIYSNTGINTDMSTGDVITVTIITTAAAAGFSTGVEVDGVPISPSWIGGSNPSAGGTAGVDAYSFTVIKTGAAAYKIIGNHSKTS